VFHPRQTRYGSDARTLLNVRMVGRAGIEPATICVQRVFAACQADILTSLALGRSKLDDRPMIAVNGFGQHKDSSRTTPMKSRGLVCEFLSDQSGSVHVLVLPRVASNLGGGAETARCACLLSYVVCVTAAAAASDVSLRPATRPERRRALSHLSSLASAKLNDYLCQPLCVNWRWEATGSGAG